MNKTIPEQREFFVKLPDGHVVSMDSPEYREYLRAEVAKAPPLRPETKARLYVLLAPMREALRERALAELDGRPLPVYRNGRRVDSGGEAA
jgi:hypothetical protein